MLLSLALSSLLAVASVVASRGPHLHVIARCSAAPNCETFVDAHNVTNIRFKDGMGPGSAWYNNTFSTPAVEKRRSTVQSRISKLWRREPIETNMTISDTQLDYGDQRPSDVIAKIKDVCLDSGICTEEAITVSSTSAFPSGAFGINLVLTAVGQYRDATDRDNFLAAILEAATQGTQERDQEWSISLQPSEGGIVTGTVHIFSQTAFIGVHRFDGGNLQGFMQVSIAQDTDSSGWCTIITSLLAGIAGAVSGIAGGVFGVAAAFCP